MDFNIILELDKPIIVKARGDLWDSEIKCAIKKGSFFNTTLGCGVVYNMCVFFVYNMISSLSRLPLTYMSTFKHWTEGRKRWT